MANMSYARFQNTSMDLNDCFSAMEDFDTMEDFLNSLSDDEKRAAGRLLKLCEKIYGLWAE